MRQGSGRKIVRITTKRMRTSFKIKQVGQKVSPAFVQLLDRKGSWQDSMVDWGGCSEPCAPITTQEATALKASSKTKSINTLRAMRVKALMLQGVSVNRICLALRHHGTGYGESSIKHDHAALSPTVLR